jgi:predicted transcriptional regulator
VVFVEAFFISIESGKMNNFKLAPEIFKYKLDAKSLHIYCYLLANKNKRVMNYELEEKLHNLNKYTLSQCFYELKQKKLISPKPAVLKNVIKCRYLCKDFDVQNAEVINFNKNIFGVNLSHKAFQIYLYLRANLNSKVTNEKIIHDLKLAKATFYKYLKELRKNNLLSKSKNKSHNKILCIF